MSNESGNAQDCNICTGALNATGKRKMTQVGSMIRSVQHSTQIAQSLVWFNESRKAQDGNICPGGRPMTSAFQFATALAMAHRQRTLWIAIHQTIHPLEYTSSKLAALRSLCCARTDTFSW